MKTMKTLTFNRSKIVRFAIMLFGITLFAFGPSSLSTGHVQAFADEEAIKFTTPEIFTLSPKANISEAVVSITTDQVSFDALEDVVIHVTIHNPNEDVIQVLKWFTPVEGVKEPLFAVTRDGEPATYLGAVYKRSTPTEQDYIALQPGGTLSWDVNLSDYYNFSISGNYSVMYDTASPELYIEQDNPLSRVSGHLISNRLDLFVESRAVPEFKDITPQMVTGSTGFTNCSISQQNNLQSARSNASIYAADSLGYFNAGKTGLRYTTWFGGYDSGRYNAVRSHFTNISSTMDTALIHFDCSCQQQGVYAYVHPSQPYAVYLCSAFWSAPLTGTDSMAGTLIHEVSHFNVVAGTDDFVYGQVGAKNLAISNPNNAINNADNHEYFAENNPVIVELDNYEPDNTSGEARWIYSGTPQTHSIIPTGDTDWVKFQLTGPSAVILETSGTVASDTRMWLYDSSLTQIKYNDDKNPGTNTYSYISTCTDPSSLLPAGTYYVKVDELDSNNEILAYTLSFFAGSNCIDVELAGESMGTYILSSGSSTRQNYIAANNGPVQVISANGISLIAAERVIYNVSGSPTSFSEMMGLPASQLDTTYWLPWYNNVDLDTQLRFGNVSDTLTATVRLFIGGVEKVTGCLPANIPYPIQLAPGASLRVSCAGVNSGPVKIVSNVDIVAAERVIYNVNGFPTSFSEMMGLPASQLDTTYWMPWYNNVDLDTQLRFGNVSGSTATVRLFIGGVEKVTGCLPANIPYPIQLAPGASLRVSCAGVNSGPVKIVSNVDIVASERVIYNVNGVPTSFSEMMGLPNGQLNTTYWMPWYNNIDLDTQLRFGNVSGTTATVRLYIGGVEKTSGCLPASIPYPIQLAPGASLRVSCAGLNNGPVRVVSNVDIVAAERVIYNVNNVPISFSEMMGLPNSQLNTSYWLPWYNNVDLDTQLRFGMP